MLDMHNHILIPLHHTSMHAFCRAAAGSDGRIRVDTHNTCMKLLLVQPTTRWESGVVSQRIAHMTDPRQSRCPVTVAVECGRMPCRSEVAATTVVQRRLQPPSAHWPV